MQSAVPLRRFAHVREPSTLSAMSSHSNLGQKSDYAKYTGSYYANRIGGTTLLVARHVRPDATSCDPRQSLVMRELDNAVLATQRFLTESPSNLILYNTEITVLLLRISCATLLGFPASVQFVARST